MLSQLRTYGLLIAAFAMPLTAQPHRIVRGTVSPQARPRFARGRDYIMFSGTAGQVERAMRTEMHRYQIRGEMHYANATEVSLPESVAPLVAAIHGLHDFRPQPPQRRVTAMGSAPVSGAPLGP